MTDLNKKYQRLRALYDRCFLQEQRTTQQNESWPSPDCNHSMNLNDLGGCLICSDCFRCPLDHMHQCDICSYCRGCQSEHDHNWINVACCECSGGQDDHTRQSSEMSMGSGSQSGGMNQGRGPFPERLQYPPPPPREGWY